MPPCSSNEATVGAMRDIDRLAAAALRETARKKRKLVERDVVTHIIEADTKCICSATGDPVPAAGLDSIRIHDDHLLRPEEARLADHSCRKLSVLSEVGDGEIFSRT